MKSIFISFFLFMLLSAGSCEPKTSENQSEAENTIETVVEKDEPYLETYASGQPKIKGLMRNGKRHGLWVAFYENGVRWSEENYREGMKDGRSISFYPNGLLRYRGQYIEEKKVGEWEFYNEEGLLIKKEKFEL